MSVSIDDIDALRKHVNEEIDKFIFFINSTGKTIDYIQRAVVLLTDHVKSLELSVEDLNQQIALQQKQIRTLLQIVEHSGYLDIPDSLLEQLKSKPQTEQENKERSRTYNDAMVLDGVEQHGPDNDVSDGSGK